MCTNIDKIIGIYSKTPRSYIDIVRGDYLKLLLMYC